MLVDLVFEGGGVLGICYIGALKALEEKGYSIGRCAGTSAGSVISALTIAGYNNYELAELLKSTDFTKFLKRTKASDVLFGSKLVSLLLDKGQYDSEYIEEWMNYLLKKKGIVKFKQVLYKGESRLKIVAADITRRKMVILPDDLKEYDIDFREFSIARAVRMSCAIPIFFTPVILKSNKGVSYIVDGGLLSCFPVWIFDIENTIKYPTLGIKIKDKESLTSQGKKDLLSYIKDIIYAPLNENQENFIRDKERVRIIEINYKANIVSTNFDKANSYINDLFMDGYLSTSKFLNSFSIERYNRCLHLKN